MGEVGGLAGMGHNEHVEILSADLALDEALVAAVEFAHDAVAAEVGADRVGEHLEVAMEGERLATHLFNCLSPGYRGWRWAVTLARTPGDQSPTVCDVALLPGSDALVGPAWVPWSERVQPGDLSVGDVFPTGAQDPRLVAGFTDEDDLDGVGSQSPLSPSTWEVGLGRARVLSQIGRDDAADRWYAGDTGPDSAMAKSAPLTCLTCGFLMPMGGAFGQMFAVCANVMAPADGRVVALDYGCGAHSEVQIDDVVDEATADDVPASDPDPELSDEHEVSAVGELLPDLVDDDLLEAVIEDPNQQAPGVELEGVLPDDAGEQDEPVGLEADSEPAASTKRPRGRGWLRGRTS